MAGALPMLRSRTDFAALQSGSRSGADSLLVVRYRRNELDHTRFGISTGRKLGNAVVRNRARRRLRETLRTMAPLAPGFDVLIVCRAPAAAASQKDLGASLASLVRAAGLTVAGEAPAGALA